MTGRSTAAASGLALLAVYLMTLAPGVTFWDAGEFIAAAHGFGIPHPPGTPLYVAIDHIFTSTLGPALGVARASNLLSALCTALAGGMSAFVILRGARSQPSAHWGAATAALCAGLGCSVWANATETEVYAFALAHVVLMLASAQRAADGVSVAHERWVLCTAYLIALCPAIHLSALVGAPAVAVLAARTTDGRWHLHRLLLLGGVMLAAAGVGRVSWPLVVVGVAIMLLSGFGGERSLRSLRETLRPVVVTALAASPLIILLVRATHDPALNQGDPSTVARLLGVVSRSQYDVAPLWPRQAPVWIQTAALAQYADWQFGIGLGNEVFTSTSRVIVTIVFVLLGLVGWRALKRDGKFIADSLLALGLCGTLGVCVYLNLKAGASLGYGMVPPEAHEARERDYFFVLGFWAWGLFAGYGAFSIARARRLPASMGLVACIIPLAANWRSNDRSSRPDADAPRLVAEALLSSVPQHGVLFVAGDNDTYPVWYLQQVEGFRTDVTVITIPLLSADWYYAQLAQRMHLAWPVNVVPGAHYLGEQRAALIAAASRAVGRPIAATTQIASRERALIGSSWRFAGAVYLADSAANGSNRAPTFGPLSNFTLLRATVRGRHRPRLPDDVTLFMRSSLECGRLRSLTRPTDASARDSLEVTCNVR